MYAEKIKSRNKLKADKNKSPKILKIKQSKSQYTKSTFD